LQKRRSRHRHLEIAGLATQAAMEWGLNAGNIFAALQHPKIVEASVKRALKPDGMIDRRMQFLHSGFLPKVGDATFNISAHAESESQAAARAAVVTPGLPPFETETLERAKLVRDDANDAGQG
jgi:hypothetical protein